MKDQPVDFLTDPPDHKGTPRVSIMLRFGSWMINNAGIFRWCRVTSANGRIKRYDWVPVLRRRKR